MEKNHPSRREFISSMSMVAGGLMALPAQADQLTKPKKEAGDQRLSLARLKQWEAMHYGMFIHFGMSTFTGDELDKGEAASSVYAPDNPDPDQWIAVAKEAGMKYAILTTKHVAGHCLWPSKYTDYTVATSGNKKDLVGAFVEACRKYGVKPGFYYCSWDNHNTFGSMTPTMIDNLKKTSPPGDSVNQSPFTSSTYQTFQTEQITELLTQYGDIEEMWIDIPIVLGRGYRTFLYNHIAGLQPRCVIMMNSGIGTGEKYNVSKAWPSDLIAIERNLPPESGHVKWREIEGKRYYVPGEVCDPIGKEWFFVRGDNPRSEEELANQYSSVIKRGANLLLNVPPEKRGVIPDMYVKALLALKKNVGI